METHHTIHAADARDMAALSDGSVDLVVTSPPYPMIEMWDDLFGRLDPAIETHLAADEADAAFERMHDVLASVWDEVDRVVGEGGLVCVTVGDATRSVDGRYRVWPNHPRVLDAFTARGFDPLPDVLWRKPTNTAAKFMGSGMVPPNAYVTLEHEFVLVFRKGEARSFEPKADRRYESAYFWEERNRWFSDLWTDVTGEFQALPEDDLRDRSAAFPFEVPYRLINMYSLYGDTVLDPFWGTGTTSLAAMVAGRNSVGYELDSEFGAFFADRLADLPAMSHSVLAERLTAHRSFVAETPDADLGYRAEHYDLPVRTRQERGIRFYEIANVRAENSQRDDGKPSPETDDNESSDRYRVSYVPYDPAGESGD